MCFKAEKYIQKERSKKYAHLKCNKRDFFNINKRQKTLTRHKN